MWFTIWNLATKRSARRRTCPMPKIRRSGLCWSWLGRRAKSQKRAAFPPAQSGARLPTEIISSRSFLRDRSCPKLFHGGAIGSLLAQRPAIGNAALVEIVWRDRHGHRVARQNADEILPDFARN